MKIEAIFGGILALFVVAVAVFAMFSIGGGAGYSKPSSSNPYMKRASAEERLDVLLDERMTDGTRLCQCFDEARRLASEGVEATSSRYRTGYTQCRALAQVEGTNVDGGEAWTAGWNAAVSAKPEARSCRAFKRARGI